MDFMKIGSLTNYTKTMKLKNDWNKKKRENDFESQSKKSELERKNDQFKADFKKQQEENKTDKMLQTINSKIAAGTDLTPAEMRYLQTKNPSQYQTLKNREIEKKNYERELKRCKTKEDVERLKMSTVSSALSSINAVKSNPNIPEATRLAVAQAELQKLDDYNKINEKFVKSGEYAKLPTEDEVRQFEKDKAEAKEAAIEKLHEAAKKLVSDMEAEFKAKDDNAADTETDIKSETELQAEVKVVDDSAIDNAQHKKINIEEPDERPTENEAEYSPEAHKVKRARAKAAYSESKNVFKNTNFTAVYIADKLNKE